MHKSFWAVTVVYYSLESQVFYGAAHLWTYVLSLPYDNAQKLLELSFALHTVPVVIRIGMVSIGSYRNAWSSGSGSI